jgi:hypothetical protein
MVSNVQSDTELLHCDPQNTPSASRTQSTIGLPSKGKDTQYRVMSLVNLLTVHLHILDKTVDDLQGLRCRYPSLILGEPIQPLEYHFDVLLSKKLLDKFFCITLSEIISPHRRRTHLVFPA